MAAGFGAVALAATLGVAAATSAAASSPNGEAHVLKARGLSLAQLAKAYRISRTSVARTLKQSQDLLSRALLVFFGTYLLECLSLSHGVYTLR